MFAGLSLAVAGTRAPHSSETDGKCVSPGAAFFMAGRRRKSSTVHRREDGERNATFPLVLACLCSILQTSTGFVGHFTRGPSISAYGPVGRAVAASTTTAAFTPRGQPSLPQYVSATIQRQSDRRKGSSTAFSAVTTGSFSTTSSSLKRGNMIAIHSSGGRRYRCRSSARALACRSAGVATRYAHRYPPLGALGAASRSGSAEVTSDIPTVAPKRRGRPPKSASLKATAEVDAPSTTIDTTSDAVAKVSPTTTAKDTVKSTPTDPAGSAIEAAEIAMMKKEMALLEKEEEESGVWDEEPTAVVSPRGFVPYEQFEDEDEDDEDDEEEKGDAVKPAEAEAKGDDAGPKMDQESKDALDKEEARQDEVAAAIKRQGIKVGAFGKERLIYHHDYVVHEGYGFCRYLASEFTKDANPDEILLEFADKNYAISKEDSYLLTRYRAADAARVPLSVMSESANWMRHKMKVQDRVTKQAVNVMDLYAKRARIEREPCRPDGPEMIDFCSGFEHTPTSDQIRCLNEIENDMIWRKVPMDRLLCGDVGFGKTEVALRAMFRMVRNKKQVALLAPTTILAAQHFRTLMKRMPEDVTCALLRGGNTLGSRQIKEAIKNNTIDIVVGTHSLLSRKVDFPNLGLLVVDEEQKFGVNQKEKLKVLTTGVDVLTLTATPIPRTLHMSLTGIRDLSTIFSPPSGRQNVTTYIMKGTDDIVQRALTREMSRGGQIFFVVPRINQIEEAWHQITRCAPNARVAIGHSKVKNLEDVVLQFTLGRGDVLLATSIIENGIDMPNVNSIVVMDSHMFGLSQLYQMRGRVGRSDVAAYTYLLYPPGYALTNEAKRRLKAMRELSHLGSGFELANRDLEIRGAGNIFGTDQSGDLKDIGYELYMNMLEKAIVSVRGTDIVPVDRCMVDMGFAPELEGSVPEDYMTCDEDEQTRQLERLRVCNSFRELVRIAKEWVTDYKTMPTPVRRLFKNAHLHTACRLLGVSSLNLEFLPKSDATSASLGTSGEGEQVSSWMSGTGLKRGEDEREAARMSHQAADMAEKFSAGRDAEPQTPEALKARSIARGEAVEASLAQAKAAAAAKAADAEAAMTAASTGAPVLAAGMEVNGAHGTGDGDTSTQSLSPPPPPPPTTAVQLNGAASRLGEGGQGATTSTAATEPEAKLVPFAVMRGPGVDQERWEILLRHGPLGSMQLRHVTFRLDANGIAIQGTEGEEEAWLKGNREEWLDHLLSLLLPLVEYVETKQSLQMNLHPPPQRFVS